MTEVKIDPVTLAILKGRLEQIADEMDATLFRSAFNPIIAEAHDASHGIYDAKTGETLVQGKSGLPIFVGVMAFAVKAVIDKVECEGGLQPGDVVLSINGRPLGDINVDRMALANLASSGSVSVELLRNGQTLTITTRVPETLRQ